MNCSIARHDHDSDSYKFAEVFGQQSRETRTVAVASELEKFHVDVMEYELYTQMRSLCASYYVGRSSLVLIFSHATRVSMRTAWDWIETRPKIYRGSLSPFLATRTLQDKQPDRTVQTVRLF